MGESNDSVVVTRGLTKVFRDFWLREKVTAVADLDLDVRPREVFGLLGPNGSGKSTTLKMILGLLFPTRGWISVFGRLPTDVRTKSRIGFLPEDSHLYPFLDARETLDFYGRLFHQPRPQRRQRVEMLLDMVGLSSVAHRRIGEYSKGMQRRIGLAQALINDPDLLILDEPTSGMDPIGTKQFKDVIRMLADRGKTVILSSHLLGNVEDVCDRVCILYGGRRQAVGSVDELLSRKSFTQITTDRLDEQILAKVSQVLSAAGRDVVEVSAPREKLEGLFLRIVREARERRLATGGMVADGEVAEFLRARAGETVAAEPEGRQVIEELVAAASESRQAPPEPPAEQPPAPPEPAEEVIVDLVEAAREASSPAQEPSTADEGKPEPRPAPDRRADREVIDELLGKESDDSEAS